MSCSFYDVVSDGKKYVWGAVSRGVPKIDVFDIDTGATVGSFETCNTPRDIEYHPLRDEIWVRCSGTNSEEVHDETETYIDVFSVTSPGVDTVANVLLTSNSMYPQRLWILGHREQSWRRWIFHRLESEQALQDRPQ